MMSRATLDGMLPTVVYMAPRFQIQGGELSLRAFTESTQAAGGTTGRERQRREMWGRKFEHPLTCLSHYPLNPRSPKR